MIMAQATATVQWPSQSQHRTYCGAALQMQSLNLPSNSTSNETDITNTSIIFVNDRFVGFLYRTRKGDVFVYFGMPGRRANVSPGDEDLAAQALGAKPNSGFQLLQRKSTPPMEVNILECY